MKKLIDLYNLGVKEGVKFLNIKMYNTKGLTNRSHGVTLIVINLLLGEQEEYIVLAHEMGHFYKDCTSALSIPVSKMISEARAEAWKATYLVPYDKYKEVMRNPFVFSDFEAAEELGVDINSIVCARRRFEAKGLPISQAELDCVNRDP